MRLTVYKKQTTTRFLPPKRYVPMLGFLLLLGCILISPSPLNAQNVLQPVLVDGTAKSLDIGRNLLVMVDPANEITADKIRDSYGRVLSGTLSPSEKINLGHDGVKHWLTFRIINNSKQTNWYLDLGRHVDGRYGTLKTIHVYQMPMSFPGSQTKPEFYFHQIPAINQRGQFKLNLPEKSQSLITIEVVPNSGTPSIIPLKILSELEFYQKATNISWNDLFVLGTLLFLTLVFAGWGLRKRQLLAGFLAGYNGTAFLMLTCVLFLSPNINIDFYKDLILFLTLAFCLLGLYTTKSFFNIEHTTYTEKYFLISLALINFLLAGGALLYKSDGTFYLMILFGLPVINALMIGLMAFAQSQNGYKAGRTYFYGWLIILCASIVSLLSAYEFLPATPLLLTIVYYGVIVQSILFILALFQKYSSVPSAIKTDLNETARESFTITGLKQKKENEDYNRLLKVIEKEREMLAELRQKEALRIEEMQRSKEEADQANRAKSAFLAVVSHEIRTPMTGIMGMVRLLIENGGLSKQQKDYVMTIQESGQAMLGLLNDILDFEKIQRGKVELETISFDLHRLIHSTITLMSGHAAAKNITLAARVDDDLPRYVKGDPTRIRQVLLNLMGNAVKFTEKGGVTLFVKNLKQTDEKSTSNNAYMIYFGVQDSGIGISAEARKSLFSPFSQADSSIARKYGGSGLGLAISKGLIEAMGSSINISSKEGEGSTFFFTLPLSKGLSTFRAATDVQKNQQDQPKPVYTSPLRILLVDDNHINRKVISSFLEKDKHTVIQATMAEEAMEKLKYQSFDLVLMDIELPGLKGNEATKIIRQNPNPDISSLPVIALTGNVGTDYLMQYKADGMNDLIPKPVEPEKLRLVIASVYNAIPKEKRRGQTSSGGIGPSESDIEAPKETDSTAQPNDKPTSHEKQADQDTIHGVFNPEMLQNLKDVIGPDQLNEMLKEVLEKSEEIISAMNAAIKLSDLKAVAERAHELKGMTGNFGLKELSAIAMQIERKAKAGDTSNYAALIDAFPYAILRAKSTLKAWITS